jgi:hypothetical protein
VRGKRANPHQFSHQTESSMQKLSSGCSHIARCLQQYIITITIITITTIIIIIITLVLLLFYYYCRHCSTAPSNDEQIFRAPRCQQACRKSCSKPAIQKKKLETHSHHFLNTGVLCRLLFAKCAVSRMLTSRSPCHSIHLSTDVPQSTRNTWQG